MGSWMLEPWWLWLRIGPLLRRSISVFTPCSQNQGQKGRVCVCVCVLKSSSVCLMCSELGHSCRFAVRRHYVCVRFCSHAALTCLPSARQTCRDIGNKLVFSKSVDACWGRPEYVSSLEHVQARLTLSHNQRGKLAIHLISPLGTRSTLLFPRYKVKYATTAALFHTPHAICALVCAAVFYLCRQTPSSMLSVLNK